MTKTISYVYEVLNCIGEILLPLKCDAPATRSANGTGPIGGNQTTNLIVIIFRVGFYFFYFSVDEDDGKRESGNQQMCAHICTVHTYTHQRTPENRLSKIYVAVRQQQQQKQQR